ncbi:MAG TPA: DUF5715 family protein [Pyrinomonadaceae bacterium]
MKSRSATSYLVLILVSAAAGTAVWAALHLTAPRRLLFGESKIDPPVVERGFDSERWAEAIQKVKEDRAADPATNVPLEVPPELRHYEDRHWFLATQVAEVKKNNLQTCQDFVDLAGMIQRGELVSVPAVTDDYVLFGVGARADDSAFSRFEDDHNIALYSDSELHDAYRQLDDRLSSLQTVIRSLRSQLTALKSRARTKRSELQKELTQREQELGSISEEKTVLDQVYGQPEKRQKLLRDYDSLQALAKNFGGRAYDITKPIDRQALKGAMLSSLRPQALRVLEEVAAAYHHQFARPLPVSSLIRPEDYQHRLRRFNRAAVIIDTPPHSTGLAFDIDYRYMSIAEQNFLMVELARLKQAGLIEVLRERAANFHVFAFIDGTRPSDDLITASLDEVGGPAPEANDAAKKPEKAKPNKAKKKRQTQTQRKSRARKRR